MDEKSMVSRNQLNNALTKQIGKRIAAGAPLPEKAAAHLEVVARGEVAAATDFFDMWDRYYPMIVSLLGWADFIIPGRAVQVIKALLAVVNSQLIPIFRELLKK